MRSHDEVAVVTGVRNRLKQFRFRLDLNEFVRPDLQAVYSTSGLAGTDSFSKVGVDFLHVLLRNQVPEHTVFEVLLNVLRERFGHTGRVHANYLAGSIEFCGELFNVTSSLFPMRYPTGDTQ